MSTPTAAGFDELPMPSALRGAIRARGLTSPTLVQSRVSESRHAGRDLLVSSQTGSGKTLAFGLLIARELLPPEGASSRVTRGEDPQALVLAPTRELAVQVRRELAWLLEPAGARVLSATGGTDARDEMRHLEGGCEVLVATPGRLLDHLERKTVTLAGAKVVVLDEADEMLRFGFREDLEAILRGAPAARRTHLFSATLPPPILRLAATYQREPVRVSAGAGGSAPVSHEDIEFFAHVFAQGDREAAVVNVLRWHDPPAAIVFTATRAGAAKLGADLARRGFAAVTLSGEMTQAERTRALSSLREGRARVMVATDVAARGLDLPDVGLVVHADLPNDASGITHRSGRTGRAGRKGVSVLLAARPERSAAERMLRGAGVRARWTPLPTAGEVAAADEARLTEELAREAAAALDERAAARVDRLLDRVPVRELVAALLARVASSRPAPAELRAVEEGTRRPRARGLDLGEGGPATRPDRKRPPRDRERGARRDREAGPPVLFRVNVGERQNADPRWLMPMICRRGGIEGRDVGKIQVSKRSTLFEVSARVADRFARLAGAPDPAEPEVLFARASGRDAERVAAEPEIGPRRGRTRRPPRLSRAGSVEEPPESLDGFRGPRAKPRAQTPAGYDEPAD